VSAAGPTSGEVDVLCFSVERKLQRFQAAAQRFIGEQKEGRTGNKDGKDAQAIFCLAAASMTLEEFQRWVAAPT
jgi:hypothetical protein